MKACQISFLLMAFCAFFFATEVVAQFRIPSDPYLPKAIGAKEFQEILSNPNRIIDTLSIESLQRKYLTRRDSPRKQIAHPVSVSFSLRDASYLDVGETGRLWYASFTLNGAIGSYLEFSNFYLAKGAQMYVYDGDRKQILGAFTSANNSTTGFFATEFLYGDSFVIEVYEKSVGASRFNIDNLYYLFEGKVFGPTDILKESMNSTYDIMSAACHNDVTCHASYTSVAKSVVKMLVGGGTCSGVLIGNTSGDFTPYVLTADHCLGGGNPATIVFYFNYTSASCNSSTVSSNYGTLTGATVRARRPRRDMLLLELSSRPALDVYYAGWDRTGNIPSSAYIIHHPDGDLKKISFENDSLLTNTYTPGGILGAYDSMVHWWLELDNGTTEGGSSGAPYFDSNGRVIGAHSGRNFVTSDYCTDLEVLGYKLSENWTAANSNERLVDWLDPSSSGSNTLSGASGPAVPTVPQNLIISNEDMDVELFELQWDASANTTHYYVDRCEVPYLYASFCVWSNSVATVYTNAYQDGQIIIVQYPQPGISHIYEFRVRAANTYFTSAPSNIVSYWGERVNPDKIPTSLPKNELLPTEVSFQAYPNPFNGGTTVSFISEEPVIAGTRYSISIYDVLGRKVREFEGIFSENGRFNHSLDFSSLNSGQYIVVANVISSVGKSRYATLSVTHLK